MIHELIFSEKHNKNMPSIEEVKQKLIEDSWKREQRRKEFEEKHGNLPKVRQPAHVSHGGTLNSTSPIGKL